MTPINVSILYFGRAQLELELTSRQVEIVLEEKTSRDNIYIIFVPSRVNPIMGIFPGRPSYLAFLASFQMPVRSTVETPLNPLQIGAILHETRPW